MTTDLQETLHDAILQYGLTFDGELTPLEDSDTESGPDDGPDMYVLNFKFQSKTTT